MKVVVLHSLVPEGAGKDEDDVLIQVESVGGALSALGYETIIIPFSANIPFMSDRLRALSPAFVFNLVETVEGAGRLIYLAPALLDLLGIFYTGAGTEATFLTSNKLVAKRLLTASGILTPRWFTAGELQRGFPVVSGTYIIKSVWEHASIGLDDHATVELAHSRELLAELQNRQTKLGGEGFAESFVEGREFNISLLAKDRCPEVLPPAEILFDNYPPDKLKVVGYRAKWESGSFEFHNTPRSFDFPDTDQFLLEELEGIARRCWDLFGLRGYARVDFRVDESNRPWVLEINSNPCLSPDAGFVAAATRAGLDFKEVIERIIGDCRF